MSVKTKAKTEKAPDIPEVPRVPGELKIDGETYKLHADFNALADCEAMAGANLLMAVPAMFAGSVTAIQLRGMLFAATRKNHPEITLLKAGQMIRVDTWPDIQTALLTCGLFATA